MFYGNKMRRKMKAGAGCEDLRVRCPHYYTVATQLHAAMQVGARQPRCSALVCLFAFLAWRPWMVSAVEGSPRPSRRRQVPSKRLLLMSNDVGFCRTCERFKSGVSQFAAHISTGHLLSYPALGCRPA